MNEATKQTTSEHGGQTRFLSDTQRIVHRHLKDRSHVITEEELRNIRVGMMPPPEPENTNPHNEEDRQRNGDSDPAGIPSSQSSVEP